MKYSNIQNVNHVIGNKNPWDVDDYPGINILCLTDP